MSIDLNYGFGDSKKLLDKVRRDKEALFKAVNKQDALMISDSVFNFAVTGYHIKDWLKNEGVTGVEEFINNHLMLRVCADLCNGNKHKLLSSPRETSDAIVSIVNSELTCDMTTITWDSSLPINGYTVRIELTSGKIIEIIDFANKVVNHWELFFANKNI